jgi:type II secretory pathway component PulK
MNAVKPWRIIVAFVLVFVAGMAAGMVWVKFQSKRSFERSFNQETWIAEAMEKLDREVKLTPEQRPKIHTLVEAGAKQVRTNLVRMATDSALLIDRLNDDIDKELTPEQRTAHGRMREEFRKRMREALKMEFKGNATNAPTSNASAGKSGP